MTDLSADSVKEFFVLLLAGLMAGVLLYIWDSYIQPQLTKAGVPYGGIA